MLGGSAPLIVQSDPATPPVVVVPGQMKLVIVFTHVGQFMVKQPTTVVAQPDVGFRYMPGGERVRTYVLISLPAAGHGVMYLLLQLAPRTLAHRVAARAAPETKWYAYMARPKSMIPIMRKSRIGRMAANS